MATKVVLNPAAFTALRHHPGVVAEMQRRGEVVLNAAKSKAPVRSGKYVNGLYVTTDRHPTRTVAHVVASAKHSMAVEARHGVLTRAIDAAQGKKARRAR